MKHIKTLEDELISISGRDEGYSVPEGYFCHLYSQINQEIGTHYDAVPQQYFDELPTKIWNRAVREKGLEDVKTFTLLRRIVAVAAIGLLLVTLGISFLQSSNTTNASDVQELVYLEYFEENIDEFDLNLVLDLEIFTEEDVDLDTEIYQGEDYDNYLESNLDEIDEQYLEDLL